MTTKKRTGKPVSQRKIAANRANAKKSTGPKTPGGKARSSQNAVKHGIFAESAILPNDPEESLEQLQFIRTSLLLQFEPIGPLEAFLIDRFVATYWRLRRVCRFEVQSIMDLRERCTTRPYEDHREDGGNSLPYPPQQLPQEDDINLVIRYEGMLDRTLHRLTQQLIRLRTTPIRPYSDCEAPDPETRNPEPDSSSSSRSSAEEAAAFITNLGSFLNLHASAPHSPPLHKGGPGGVEPDEDIPSRSRSSFSSRPSRSSVKEPSSRSDKTKPNSDDSTLHVPCASPPLHKAGPGGVEPDEDTPSPSSSSLSSRPSVKQPASPPPSRAEHRRPEPASSSPSRPSVEEPASSHPPIEPPLKRRRTLARGNHACEARNEG